MRRGVDLPSAPASSGAASSSSLSSGGAGSTVSISEGGRDESGRDPRRTTPSSAMDGSLLARRRNSSLLLSRSSSVTTMTTGTASRELSVRIAQEMSSVLDADEDWDRHQKIQRALQRHNFTLHRLRLSDLELYGRERELNELREAFQEVADVDSTSPQPKVAVINVIGRAGTGKTRLCDELKSAVTKHNGFFLAGKFDLQNRQEPFTGLVSALSGLTIQVLERGDVFADSMKVQLTDAIGNESRALASFVPGIEELVVSVDHVSIPNDIGRATEQHPVDSGCDPSSSMATTTTEHHSVEEWDEDDKLMTRSSSLHYLFRQFFRCICRPAHPVVLMLDDMQWSDEASLSLLSSIVTDPSLSNLLVLATCREEEVDEEHPWRNFLNNLRASHSTKVACRQVVLSNLDQSAVLSIVQAALRCSEERTVWLAEIVHRKSSGNALYAIQFLSSLYDEGILRYNVGSMSWVWNERAVQSRFVTANVVDLTTAKLQKLPPQMQTLLMVAACLGRTFDKTMLNLVMNQETLASLLGSPLAPSSLGLTRADAVASTVVTARALKGLNSDEARDTLRAASHPHPAAAIQESPPHVTLPASGTLANKEEKEEDNANVDWLVASLHQLVEDSVIEHIAHYNTYCFAHDMIQEAAFRLVPEKLCGAFQREVGFALLRSHAIKELEENFYFRAIELSNVASHEIGISYLDTVHLVHHNHDAGHRAMKKAAFGAALKYFEAGLRLIGDGKSDTKLLIDLISGAVEAAFCSGNLVAMEGHIANALAVDTPIENKVRVYLTRISSYGSQDKHGLAITTGRQVLIEMGITRLPRRPKTHHVIAELLKTKRVLRNHTKNSLMALPTIEDKRWLQAMSIVDIMLAVAYCCDINLFAVMNLRMLRWTIRFGVCCFSPNAISAYGVVLCHAGELRAAQTYGTAAMLVSDRLNATSSRSKTILCTYALVAPWQTPYRNVFKMLQYGYKLGMKTGELEIAMCNLAQYNFALVATSAMPLKTFIPKIRSDNNLMHEYGQDGILNFGLLSMQFALNMAGPVEMPTVMSGEAMCEENFRATFVSAEHRMLIGWLNHCCLKLAYFFGDYDRADEVSRMSDDFAVAAGGHPYVYRHALFSSLTAFAMARKVPGRRRQMRQWRRALRIAKQVQTWSEAGNVNCSHLTLLLQAERLSFFKSKELEAKRMYNAAIISAHRSGYLNDKALAHELAFLFHLRLATADRTSPPRDVHSTADGGDDWFWAHNHFKDAVEAYGDWNAFQKVKQLVDTYGVQFQLAAT